MQKRRVPSKKVIKKYWQEYMIGIGKFDDEDDFWSDDHCFACGFDGPTERAHIMAKVLDGSDTVDNVHLLCAPCHKQSEYLDGSEYFMWLKNQTLISSILQGLSMSRSHRHMIQDFALMICK